MDCTLILPDSDELTEAEWDSLRKQDVDLDDWDFLLLVPPEMVEQVEVEDAEWKDGWWQKVMVKQWRPREYTLERFETGCYRNKWYRVNFRGKDVALLVAYHG